MFETTDIELSQWEKVSMTEIRFLKQIFGQVIKKCISQYKEWFVSLHTEH